MRSALLFLPSPDHYVAMLDGGPGGMRVPLCVRDVGGTWAELPQEESAADYSATRCACAILLTLDGEEQLHGWLALWMALVECIPGYEAPFTIEGTRADANQWGLGRFIEIKDGAEVTRG
jgi:hypothetical protein